MVAPQYETNLGDTNSDFQQSPIEPTGFPQFVFLPPEIRLQIWRFALPTPHNAIFIGEGPLKKFPIYGSTGLLEVCKESQLEVLSQAKKIKQDSSSFLLQSDPLDINFEKDEVHLVADILNIDRNAAHLQEVVRRARRLFIPRQVFDTISEMTVEPDPSLLPDQRRIFTRICARNHLAQLRCLEFQNLREICVVITEKDDELKLIIGFRYLRDTNPEVFREKLMAARLWEPQLYQLMKNYGASADWRNLHAKNVVSTRVIACKEVGVPRFSVLFPGRDGVAVVEERGDVDKSVDEYQELKKPWLDFTWPAIKMTYPEIVYWRKVWFPTVDNLVEETAERVTIGEDAVEEENNSS